MRKSVAFLLLWTAMTHVLFVFCAPEGRLDKGRRTGMHAKLITYAMHNANDQSTSQPGFTAYLSFVEFLKYELA